MGPTKKWDTELYEGRFSFVWSLGADLVELLAPRRGERILDLGCGTGQLSQKIAESGALVTGLDSDPAMIGQARMNYPKLSFVLADAREFRLETPVDGVFSNAALHWVVDAEKAVGSIARALIPGGRFVAEFGGRGNIAKLMAGVRAETGVDTNPWYFPSLGEYATLLERHGFRVTHGFEIDRDTELEGDNGIEEWLRMFGDALLEPVPRGERAAATARIVERLRPVLYRDGKWWADYVRLRVRGVKESR